MKCSSVFAALKRQFGLCELDKCHLSISIHRRKIKLSCYKSDKTGFLFF